MNFIQNPFLQASHFTLFQPQSTLLLPVLPSEGQAGCSGDEPEAEAPRILTLGQELLTV